MLMTLQEAKEHLRVIDDDEELTLQIYINAAVASVSEHIQRMIYEDQTALDDAFGKLKLLMASFDRASLLNASAQQLYANSFYAFPSNDFSENLTESLSAYSLQQIESYADPRVDADVFLARYVKARDLYRKTLNGIVLEPDIKAAILLTLGHLSRTAPTW